MKRGGRTIRTPRGATPRTGCGHIGGSVLQKRGIDDRYRRAWVCHELQSCAEDPGPASPGSQIGHQASRWRFRWRCSRGTGPVEVGRTARTDRCGHPPRHGRCNALGVRDRRTIRASRIAALALYPQHRATQHKLTVSAKAVCMNIGDGVGSAPGCNRLRGAS